MAIITTNFVNTTVAADNAAEVCAWLQENATEYFDSIVLADDGLSISCYIGELAALTFSGFGGVASSYTTTVYMAAYVQLTNGTVKGFGSGMGGSGVNWTTKATKTANGICLRFNTTHIPHLFITKNADGDTMICALSSVSMSSSNRIYAVVPTMDTAFTEGNTPNYNVQTSTTTLAPIASVNGGYAPDLYSMPFNQYKGTEGIITLNGKQYYTNGYIALAD